MSTTGNHPRSDEILTNAVKRAATGLGINSRQLALILSTDESNLETSIDPESHEGFRARQFILIFRHLQALLGNNSSAMAHWVETENREFESTPIDRMQTALGLNEVIAYLESIG